MIELGYPYIDGYKPLGNYQELLGHVVAERIAAAGALEQTVAAVVAAPVGPGALPADLLGILVAAPVPERSGPPALYDRRAPVIRQQNYLAMEARNQSLGRAGEELVMAFEHRRLWEAGQRRLAERIENVARTRGDGLGYDISSFETDGRERLIEVKTTRFGALTPFYASRNEVQVSHQREREYHLYRVFGFRTDPKMFQLRGALDSTCRLQPVTFLASPA